MFTVGSEHDMLGTSSWSCELDIAEDFAGGNFGQYNAVIFHCATQGKGTAIRHLVEPDVYGEDEVLVSKESRYRVTKIKRIGPKNVFDITRTHIYLEEI